MNGKQAKRLRKAAVGLAVTIEQGGRKVSERDQHVEQHKSYSPSSVIMSGDGVSRGGPPYPVSEAPTISEQVKNKPDSVRFIYQQFKKGVVSGKINS